MPRHQISISQRVLPPRFPSSIIMDHSIWCTMPTDVADLVMQYNDVFNSSWFVRVVNQWDTRLKLSIDNASVIASDFAATYDETATCLAFLERTSKRVQSVTICFCDAADIVPHESAIDEFCAGLEDRIVLHYDPEYFDTR